MTGYENLHGFDPRECLSGKIGRINRITASIFRKYMGPFGVTNSQVSLLFIFSKHRGLTQKELSNMAKLEKSSLHRNLKRLIDNAYVSRQDFPILRITARGRSLVNDLIPEWEKAMAEIRGKIGKDGESSINLIHQKLITEG